MRRTQRRYTPETIEAIWTLRCEGVGPADIRRKLAANEAGIGFAVEMPKRTLADHLRRLRDSRGDPQTAIKPGQEVDAADAIRRRGLELLNSQLTNLEAKAKRGECLTNAELGAIDRITRAVSELKRRSTTGKDPKQAQRRQADDSKPSTLLDRLSKAIPAVPEPVSAHLQTHQPNGHAPDEADAAPNTADASEHSEGEAHATPIPREHERMVA